MQSGEVRKYFGNGIYELLALIKLNGEELNINFSLTTTNFIDLWNLMFPEEIPKEESFYDKDFQRKEFEKIFKKYEIPLYYIDNFISNEIKVDQIQDLKENHLNILIDKIGHQLKLKNYIETEILRNKKEQSNQ